MFTFIHAADIHLDSPLTGLERYEGAPVAEIRGATRQALVNLVHLAIDRKVAFVLIAGDLYDGDWRDPNTGLFFVKQVTKLRDAGIHVYAVSGNHDAANIITKSLRLPKNPDGSDVLLSHNRVDSLEISNLGVVIHGRGFTECHITNSVVDQYPPPRRGLFNIGMLHTSLETETENEHSRYAPCRVTELQAKGYDYWALGHIHQRSISHQDPWISFSGNVQGRHARETGAKGCHLVTVDGRGKASMEFVPLDVFRWEHCQLDIQDADDIHTALDCFSAAITKLYDKNGRMPLAVRVSIFGRSPAHERIAADSAHWVNQLRATAVDATDGRVWIEKVRQKTSPSISFEQSILRDGPISELVRHLGELKANEEMAQELIGELDELYRKLPDELKHGADGIDWTAPQRLCELLGDVEPLLIGRLLDQED